VEKSISYLLNPPKLHEKEIDSKMKGKMFLNLGKWVREDTEELSEESIFELN